MRPFRQDALGLALIACSIGVLVCRAEATAVRRDGIFRNPAKFGANVTFWTRLAWLFATGAFVVAGAWTILSLAEG